MKRIPTTNPKFEDGTPLSFRKLQSEVARIYSPSGNGTGRFKDLRNAPYEFRDGILYKVKK